MHALRRVPAVSAACRALSSRAALAPPAAVETSARGRAATLAAAAAVLAGAALALAPSTPKGRQKHSGSETSVSNWSNTHEVHTNNYHQPESLEELESLVAHAQSSRTKLRPVGSGLSPNGLGFSPGGMVNLALCDQVLHVDPAAGRVTLQAGARLEVALKALGEHGWTLQNFSSIKEQQVGGWTQAGCHGTGAGLPPVEETVVSMKLVTPAKGALLLDGVENNPDLFHLAKVGLGALGVVAEVTLQGVRAHSLGERTQVLSAKQVQRDHAARLATHRHVRYMWLPYTDDVVVVTADPLDKCPAHVTNTQLPPEHVRTAALRQLLRSHGAACAGLADDQSLSFADLRDKLLALNPLSAAHVAEVNKAEATFWRASQGWRVGDSQAILGFDCGGEQCVSEVAFPCGTRKAPNGADLEFVRATLKHIREHNIPAPAPLEQRWSCGSRAPMSPVYSAGNAGEALHCWLGIIMYLPPSSGHGADSQRRRAVEASFEDYKAGWQRQVCLPYKACDHWAKIELPATEAELVALRQRLRQRFPVDAFNRARQELDPHNLLGNELVDALFPRQRTSTSTG